MSQGPKIGPFLGCTEFIQSVPFTPLPRQQFEPRREADGVVGRYSLCLCKEVELDKLS
jgi:hypothetical protein